MTDRTQANWQEFFVAINLLPLGYNAWSGFLAGERGAVVCSLNSPQLGLTGESFRAHYIPRSRLASFLNAWLAFPDTAIVNHHHITSHILQAVDGYNSETDVILLLESGDRASFLYLWNLPIAPPRGYEIVCKGWEAFHLDPTTFAEMQLLQVDLTPPHWRIG
ncbi:MAG: hypothetical protein AAFY30_14935 [Cyanobacteria bacterium J06642_12]